MLALAFHVGHGQLGLGGKTLNDFTYDWLYDSIVAGAAISCLVRAYLIREERLPWLLLGVGLAFDAAGEAYYSLAFGNSGNPPVPSLADLLYLLYYPFAYSALVLLARRRTERFSRSSWLDGAIAAAAAAAMISSLAFEPILHSVAHANVAALATTLAYPVGDMILLAIVMCVLGLSGWRPGRAWLLLGIGLVLWAAADTSYAYANADGTYVVGGWLDSMWLASAVVTGAAAWQPPRSIRLRVDGVRLLVLPAVFALAALGVLIYGGFHHVAPVGLLLAGAAVVLVIVRVAWTVRENSRLLAITEREAVTDALTGLGNRRKMQATLERALCEGASSPIAVFVMFDLDGFKAYNDRFGHLAGDTLLAHLGRRLEAATGRVGSAFRPGGDEFCVLLDVNPAEADMHVAAALAALSAEGEGFAVTASYGMVAIPSEADTPTLALRLADDRMYAQKEVRTGSAGHQTHDVLLGLLRERQPELHHHLCEVGRLAVVTGRRLGMTNEELDELRRAAELHDIGKAAIPDAILNKPGPLTDEEWDFMRRHTIVGERILAAAPALVPVAALVRSSHERWDGTGYPDGRPGPRIPLGARIVFVCDAFDAMTGERPYSRARTPEEAIAELRRNAGSQFDPEVVEAFVQAWTETAAHPAPRTEASLR
ncbi:MAG: diguanylate cyclase [Solirubrobacterales bacterium]|nr:diguanylate cyclase [Solirubrobacterales bacterium]